jgi:hypothetical protein
MATLGAALVTAFLVAGNEQQEDYSGLMPFWAIADTVAAGQEPSASAWAALFATPGYRTLRERDNADRFLQRLLPLALSPEDAAEAEGVIAEQPLAGMFIAHLRAAYEQREELALFRAGLEQRPLLLETVATAQQWLPEGSVARFGAPALSFVIYQPDARGYDRIVVDLLLAFEQPAIFEDLLAHETHHVIRARLQGSWSTGDLPESHLLHALDNLQAEGVADMIDKPSTLAVTDWGDTSTGSALALLSGRMHDELERVQQRLVAVDEILAGYASGPGSAEELGERLREELVLGGHPVGYHMAGVIVAAGGRQRMIDNVADPFDFVRAYNDAAFTDPAQHHVFSDEALRGLALLQELTEQPESPQPGARPAAVADIPPTTVVPSPEQLAYQRMELIGFVHFTVGG